jgi:hypothetical protein
MSRKPHKPADTPAVPAPVEPVVSEIVGGVEEVGAHPVTSPAAVTADPDTPPAEIVPVDADVAFAGAPPTIGTHHAPADKPADTPAVPAVDESEVSDILASVGYDTTRAAELIAKGNGRLATKVIGRARGLLASIETAAPAEVATLTADLDGLATCAAAIPDPYPNFPNPARPLTEA